MLEWAQEKTFLLSFQAVGKILQIVDLSSQLDLEVDAEKP